MQLFALPAFVYAFWQIKKMWWSLPQSTSDNYSQKAKLKVIFFCFGLLLFYIFQLFYPLAPSPYPLIFIVIGYSFVVAGFWFCKMALVALGTNWSSLLDYQIKPGQKLVTTGIYKYLRHPLYLGDILWLTGLELVLNSWLFIPLFLLLSFLFRRHSIKEDKLLKNHFGQKYKNYGILNSMKKLFLFISFISLFTLLALFAFVPAPALAADPADPCDINTQVVDPTTVNIFRSLAGTWLGTKTDSQADCDSLTNTIGQGRQIQGYTFNGFSYCSAQAIYTGNNANTTGREGCYPVLLDPNGVSVAQQLNKNIPLSNIKPTCEVPCIPSSTVPGGCTSSVAANKASCEKQQAVCHTVDFGDARASGGQCFLDADKINVIPGSLVGAKIHLCSPWGDPCETALGVIPLNPAAFVEKIIKFILGISGGVIVIMAIVAGYNVMTSAGDPQKLASSKEMIISVITGAFMIVFSMILLNAIGIDILGLPPLIQYRGYGGDGG